MNELRNGKYEEDGRLSYYKDGKLHREDGPAREFKSGDKLWFLNGQPHRVDGPAHDRADGVKIWYLNGKIHRDDGPAFEAPNGRKEWLIHGEHHREDGPAVEDPVHGDEWWFDGIHYPSRKEFPGSRVKLIQKEISTLNEVQLEQIADIVQKMISLRHSQDSNDGPKPKK